jgi:hypothetical protein
MQTHSPAQSSVLTVQTQNQGDDWKRNSPAYDSHKFTSNHKNKTVKDFRVFYKLINQTQVQEVK